MADHRDLHGRVEGVQGIRWDAGRLVAEHHHGAPSGGGQVAEADRLVGQFHAENPGAGGPFGGEPAQRAADPVHAGGPAQRVAPGQGFVDPAERRHGQAGADGVAGTQQGAQVGTVHRPERGGDQVTPAAVGVSPAGSA